MLIRLSHGSSPDHTTPANAMLTRLSHGSVLQGGTEQVLCRCAAVQVPEGGAERGRLQGGGDRGHRQRSDGR
eukprot:5308838-Pyramimonas_sp.AAC.1